VSRGVWRAPWNDLEKIVQRKVVRLYALAGCAVYSLSQARASKQTEGLPDLWIMAPTVRAAWWHEVKSAKGKQTPTQRDFQARCLLSGISYVLGGLEDAEAKLMSVGLGRMEQGQFVLTPKGAPRGEVNPSGPLLPL
jgi:hypothetical protein